jgi:hypothetical protein
VPLKIVHPLLEAASLEDTPDLQDIWASMMVNAADPSDSSPVNASFPLILKELSSRHVKFLAALFADSSKRRQSTAKRLVISVQLTSFRSCRICIVGQVFRKLIAFIPSRLNFCLATRCSSGNRGLLTTPEQTRTN